MKVGYFKDEYQVMSRVSFIAFFENILNHPRIEVVLGEDVLESLRIFKNEMNCFLIVFK